MRYAFYLSGRGGRFYRILRQNFKVIKSTVLVFSDSLETEYMREEVMKQNIIFEQIQFALLMDKKEDRNICLSDLLLKKMKEEEVDYCFSFGAHLLKGSLLEQYRNRIINFHPSLLPLYPGKNAIDQAVLNGEKILGNTVHFIDAGMDTGKIILQNSMSSKRFEEKGYDGILDMQINMLDEVVEMIETGRLLNT